MYIDAANIVGGMERKPIKPRHGPAYCPSLSPRYVVYFFFTGFPLPPTAPPLARPRSLASRPLSPLYTMLTFNKAERAFIARAACVSSNLPRASCNQSSTVRPANPPRPSSSCTASARCPRSTW